MGRPRHTGAGPQVGGAKELPPRATAPVASSPVVAAQYGLGTLEVAIALVILAFLTLTFLTVVGASWAGVTEQGHRQLAVGCATQALERLRASLLAGEEATTEGECAAAPARGLWYRLDIRPDEGAAAAVGGTSDSQGTGGGGTVGAGQPVLVTVAVYQGSPGTPAAPVYTVSTVFWLATAGQTVPAGSGS